MTFLYIAHIPFVLVFLVFVLGLVCVNWKAGRR